MVLFDWAGEEAGDLRLMEGDIVKLIRWESPEWLEGEVDGHAGRFPSVFVDITEEVRMHGNP